MPIVNNYDKAAEKWNAPQVGKLLADPAKRRSMAEAIVSAIKGGGFDGVNVDFESFTAADKANIVAFMAELYPRAKRAGLEVSMDVIVAGAAYEHVALARHVDYLIPMMYDEHWKTSPPGPISSQGWYESTLRGFYAKVPAEKVVVGLGTYAYDWGRSGVRAASKTHAAATSLARKYNKPMNVHSSGLNSTFGYSEGGVNHQVWVLDAVSMFNQMSTSYADAPRGYAIWRLGAEDPDVWKVIPYRDSLDATVAASLISERRNVVYDSGTRLITSGQTRP
jgi:spore germination protein YaaH